VFAAGTASARSPRAARSWFMRAAAGSWPVGSASRAVRHHPTTPWTVINWTMGHALYMAEMARVAVIEVTASMFKAAMAVALISSDSPAVPAERAAPAIAATPFVAAPVKSGTAPAAGIEAVAPACEIVVDGGNGRVLLHAL